ncbi:hypothetical protein ACJJTC_017862 [Scirpophaga incertulas]
MFETRIILKGLDLYDIVSGDKKKPVHDAERSAWVKEDARAQSIIVTRMEQGEKELITIESDSIPDSVEEIRSPIIVEPVPVLHEIINEGVDESENDSAQSIQEEDQGSMSTLSMMSISGIRPQRHRRYPRRYDEYETCFMAIDPEEPTSLKEAHHDMQKNGNKQCR